MRQQPLRIHLEIIEYLTPLDPAVEGVRMGSLAGKEQKIEVTEKVKQLSKTQEVVFGPT